MLVWEAACWVAEEIYATNNTRQRSDSLVFGVCWCASTSKGGLQRTGANDILHGYVMFCETVRTAAQIRLTRPLQGSMTEAK